MPSDTEAREQAATAELKDAVAGIARILDLIARVSLSRRERRLLQAVNSELARITRAIQVLDRG